MEKRQTHVMGSVTPGAVGNTPTYAQKKPTYTKMCLCITSATMKDLQADRGVDTHQGFFVFFK